MRKILFGLFFAFSFVASAQQISTGLTLFINTTDFDAPAAILAESNFAIGNSRPMIGLVSSLGDHFFGQHNISFYNLLDETASYGDYDYKYSFITFQNNLCYRIDEIFYGGVGLPLNFTTRATQSTGFGSIDLIAENNAPRFLYGYNVLVGYSSRLSEKSQLYIDFTRSRYLNSLDKDEGQTLKATTYAFAIKIAFDL